MSNIEQDTDAHSSAEDTEEIPLDRSGVESGPGKAMSANFKSSDRVAIAIEERGVLKRGTLFVHALRQKGRTWEYQLKDSNGKLYMNGRWIAQKDIKRAGK